MSMFDMGDFGGTATAVDESMDATDHMGNASVANAAAAQGGMTPTKCLAALWFLFLGAYWLCGYLFSGQRS